MAKMFYTLDEAKTALGKSEDEIKAYAKEGRLREFRDGPRLMFKADQVEQLKSEISGGDNVDLGVSDSGGLIGLVDTTGASGTSITLSDDIGQSSGGLRTKDDTALAADLGLSGSMGGVPSPSRAAPPGSNPLSGTGLSGTASGSRAGINVFGDEPETVDPSAQTAISGGIREQINLEGVGSGSGLLDLTRESDDTSLGAVLDGIGPAVTGSRREPVETMDPGAFIDEEDEDQGTSRMIAAPTYVNAPDAWAPAFGGAALGAAAMLMFAVYVLCGAMTGTWSDAARYFDKDNWIKALLFGALAVVFPFIIGLVIGKMTTKRRT
jgi:hypothetical protein